MPCSARSCPSGASAKADPYSRVPAPALRISEIRHVRLAEECLILSGFSFRRIGDLRHCPAAGFGDNPDTMPGQEQLIGHPAQFPFPVVAELDFGDDLDRKFPSGNILADINIPIGSPAAISSQPQSVINCSDFVWHDREKNCRTEKIYRISIFHFIEIG